MYQAVAQIARYETPDHTGETRREMNERFGMENKTPDPVHPDPDWLHLWEWFCDLSSARQYGSGGPMPLSYSEIRAWMELTGEPVQQAEVIILKAVDRAYLEALSEEFTAQELRRRETEKR